MVECDDVTNASNADMDESENSHHANSVRNVDIVHPVHLVSVDHVNPDAGSQTSSTPPHTKLLPCKVLIECLASPDQSPPVGMRSSKRTKRKAVIESDEEDIAPTSKCMPSRGSMSKVHTCSDLYDAGTGVRCRF